MDNSVLSAELSLSILVLMIGVVLFFLLSLPGWQAVFKAARRTSRTELGVLCSFLLFEVAGFLIVPIGAFLHNPSISLAGSPLVMMPVAYYSLRRDLHQRRLVRCDWLRLE